ncbi:DUF3306 domain-containing protein [Noviherbaspirillum sp. CPCC 100848]|uniref:DUF3306 domain-containing protein n=1 Tax=Noviherbaspirillum album TaxID=3080276 RepID=A0ABU6J5N3_9BURK|nr:DUF3306 domain-containing protein [Noviherbaspirillum sp. CPCC 100848]MEC4718943.1 DUF3306 domain-containing protein [Noviherbaspirillum sp. CPCC 100848]
MEAESFFARWSKRNAEAADEKKQAAPAEDAQPVPVDDAPRPPPTLEEVAALTPESDFKPFVARGVDENVRRSAMKKLFADPQFNVMDGLDVYIDDYSKFQPMTPQILASLNHAQALLDPLSQVENPLMRLLQQAVEDTEPAPSMEAAAQAAVTAPASPSDPASTSGADTDQAAQQRQDLNTTPNQASHDHPI